MADIAELINRRQQQLLIHSIIYYEFNDNIIADTTYDTWSKELAELQRNYPSESKATPLAEMFADFDGSTGYHLLARANEWQRGTADRLLRNHLIERNRRTNK